MTLAPRHRLPRTDPARAPRRAHPALVAKVDDAGGEGTGLSQPQVEGFGERREVRGSAAQDDRVDDEQAVFVDQVRCDGGSGQGRPMDTTPSPGSSRSRPTSVAMSSAASRAVPVTEFSVRGEHNLWDRPPDPGELSLRLAGHGLLDGLPHQQFLVQAPAAAVRGDVAGLLNGKAKLLRVSRGPADVATRSRIETVSERPSGPATTGPSRS
jgi:hypothetical protein